jgi:hypothetical protein
MRVHRRAAQASAAYLGPLLLITALARFGDRQGIRRPLLDCAPTAVLSCDIDSTFAVHKVNPACEQRNQTASDRTPYIVCPEDLAIAVLTSNHTASARLQSSLDTWIKTARRIGVNVVMYAADQLPGFPDVIVLEDVPHSASNIIRELSMMSVTDLFRRFPRAKWYLKMDDDAFLFPTNVLAVLSQEAPCCDGQVHSTLRDDVIAKMGNNGLIGHQWTEPLLIGQVHADGWTISGGAGLMFSRTALQQLTDVNGAHRCLSGDVFADVATFDGGRGYGEDVLWKICLEKLTHTKVKHVPSMHMHAPDVNWIAWTGPDDMSKFPASFHWVSSDHKRTLHACSRTSRVKQIGAEYTFFTRGCKCHKFISPDTRPQAGTFCDISEQYIRGFSRCGDGCTLVENATCNGNRDACVTLH